MNLVSHIQLSELCEHLTGDYVDQIWCHAVKINQVFITLLYECFRICGLIKIRFSRTHHVLDQCYDESV